MREPTAESAALPRIATVEAIHVRVPFRRPLLDPTGEYTHRRGWILRLVNAGGNEGLGEAVLHPAASDVTASALDATMRRLVPELAAASLPEPGALLREGDAGRAAQAAVDGALAGLRAAALGGRGGPASNWVGVGPDAGSPAGPDAGSPAGPDAGSPAGREPVAIAVEATIGFGGPDAGAEAAVQAIELGFGTLKLRAGTERRTDQLVDRLRAVRAAVGPEPRLRIEVGGAWDLETAVERLAAAEPFRLEYVAQPLAAWDLAGHAALRQRTRVPIAIDDSVGSEGAAREALAENAAAVLIVRPGRVGGGRAAVRIARAAAERGVAVVLATFFESGIGIAAGLRIASELPRRVPERADALATAGVLGHDLLVTPLPIEDGRMAVPVAIALDRREVDRLTIERLAASG